MFKSIRADKRKRITSLIAAVSTIILVMWLVLVAGALYRVMSYSPMVWAICFS